MTRGSYFFQMPTFLFRLAAIHAMTRDRALQLHLSIAHAPLTVRRRRRHAAEQYETDYTKQGYPLKPIEHVHTSSPLNTDGRIWFR
jgi:hypothetical protein